MVQSYVDLSLHDHATHEQRAGLGDEREAVDWFGERLARTAASAWG